MAICIETPSPGKHEFLLGFSSNSDSGARMACPVPSIWSSSQGLSNISGHSSDPGRPQSKVFKEMKNWYSRTQLTCYVFRMSVDSNTHNPLYLKSSDGSCQS